MKKNKLFVIYPQTVENIFKYSSVKSFDNIKDAKKFIEKEDGYVIHEIIMNEKQIIINHNKLDV